MTPGGEGWTSEWVARINRNRDVHSQMRSNMSIAQVRRNRKNAVSKKTRAKLSRSMRGREFNDSHRRNHRMAMRHAADAKMARKMNSTVAPEQRLVFVVGPDRCGKTKFVGEKDAFLNDHDYFVNCLRYGGPFLCDFLLQTRASAIFDRGYPCERVYAAFYNRKTDFKILRKLDAAYAKMGTKIVVCTRCSFAGIRDNLDENLDEEALEKLSSLYDEFIEWTQCEVLKVLVDDEDLEREMQEIVPFVKGG